MYVLIEKIRAHRGVDNNPSYLSQLPLYIIGEPSRSHPHADTIELFSNNRPYRLYRQGETNFERLTLRNATLEDHLPENFIIFANAFRLYKLSNLHPNNNRMYSFSNEFNFNMVIIDEASQYPTDHILSILPFIQNDRYDIMIDSEGLVRSPQLQNQVNTNIEDFTKIILVGDNYQLPPVNKIKAPQNLFNILSSIYNYYVDGHNISRVQLNLNYRSNEVIVGITQRLNFYEEIMTFNENIGNTIDLIENNHSIPDWLSQVLNSNTPISSIIHRHRYDLSVSVIEVNISLQIVIQLYETSNILTADGFYHFWENNLGIVAPHNSQCNLIIQRLLDYFSETNLPLTIDEIRDTISNSITSVEKFQGGARNIIISTVGISSIDQLKSEEDFIYDLTRFNVISSRAKQKFIFITSQNYLQYLPNDKDLMDNISIIRNIVYEYMDISSNFTYNCTTHNDETIEVRWKEF